MRFPWKDQFPGGGINLSKTNSYENGRTAAAFGNAFRVYQKVAGWGIDGILSLKWNILWSGQSCHLHDAMSSALRVRNSFSPVFQTELSSRPWRWKLIMPWHKLWTYILHMQSRLSFRGWPDLNLKISEISNRYTYINTEIDICIHTYIYMIMHICVSISISVYLFIYLYI